MILCPIVTDENHLAASFLWSKHVRAQGHPATASGSVLGGPTTRSWRGCSWTVSTPTVADIARLDVLDLDQSCLLGDPTHTMRIRVRHGYQSTAGAVGISSSAGRRTGVLADTMVP